MLGPILILANLDDGRYLRQILLNFAPDMQIDIAEDIIFTLAPQSTQARMLQALLFMIKLKHME